MKYYKKYNIFSFFIIIVFITACRNDANIKFENIDIGKRNINGIKIIDTFILKIPDNIPFPSVLYDVNDNNSGFSYKYSNSQSTVIIQYDIVNKKWRTHIFDFEGPNGIKGIGKYFITDKDEILYIPLGGISDKIFIFNNNDELLKTFRIHEAVIEASSNKYHCYFNNNVIYLPINQYMDFKHFGNSKLIKKLDFNTKSEENIVSVPKDFYDFHSDNSEDLSPEFVFPNDTTIVFIMRKSPNIYKYNVNTKKIEYYHYPNKNISYDDQDIKKGNFNLDYKNVKGYYHSLLYDTENKRYFRFSVFNEIRHLNKFNLKNMSFRVDVFDEKLNLTATSDFKHLFPEYAFIVKGKLYVATLKDKENYFNFLVLYPEI